MRTKQNKTLCFSGIEPSILNLKNVGIFDVPESQYQYGIWIQ